MSEHGAARPAAWDFTGQVRPEYSPEHDGEPDPGEIVWAWVPFEEDHTQGKDRPVVVIGRDVAAHDTLVVLMLSSKDHDEDRDWYPIGTGPWDPQRRASWVRLDRPLAVAPESVRREGAALDPDVFLALVEHAVATPRTRPRPGARTTRPTVTAPPPSGSRRRGLLRAVRDMFRRPGNR